MSDLRCSKCQALKAVSDIASVAHVYCEHTVFDCPDCGIMCKEISALKAQLENGSLTAIWLQSEIAKLKAQLADRDALLNGAIEKLGKASHCCRNCNYREPAYCPTKIIKNTLFLLRPPPPDAVPDQGKI